MTEASGRKEELENYNHSLGLASKSSKGCLIKLKRKVLVKTDCRLVCMVQIQDGLQGEMVVVSPCAKARKVKVCISSHRRRIMIHISMYDDNCKYPYTSYPDSVWFLRQLQRFRFL